MQQTQKYQLNLIESSDPFLPAALNENTQKVENVLAAEETARTAADSALDERVTELEVHQIICGSFDGTNERYQTVHLGVKPRALIIRPYGLNRAMSIATEAGCSASLTLEEDGFTISDSLNTTDGGKMYYVAFT